MPRVIEVTLDAGGALTVRDNGRGIPVDPHPKFPGKSALEVIMTMLHSGGKFSGKAYETSGGLHGVGVSVVNALSDRLDVEVARDRQLCQQSSSRGHAVGQAADLGASRTGAAPRSASCPTPRSSAPASHSRPRGSTAWPAPRPICSAACEIRWSCDPALLQADATPAEADACISPAACSTSWPSELGRPHRDAASSSPARESQREGTSGRGGMGRHLGREPARRRLHPLLLQHRADPAGRHARGRACARR